MPEFTPSEAKFLLQCVARSGDAFRRDVADVIRRELDGELFRPEDLVLA